MADLLLSSTKKAKTRIDQTLRKPQAFLEFE